MSLFATYKTKMRLPQLIGMLHIPISTIVNRPIIFMNNDCLPIVKGTDNRIWIEIEKEFRRQNDRIIIPEYKSEFPGVWALSKELKNIHDLVKKLSFIKYLEDRVSREIECYKKYGMSFFQIENIGGPYAARNDIPIIEQAVMEYMASFIKANFQGISFGIQILSYGDNIALEIATRHSLAYVRGESFMFSGFRPDTSNQFSGTLKKAYLMRGFFCRDSGKEELGPHIFVDLKKKHTFFPDSLSDIVVWLDNVRFLKLEGIILTGKYTGQPIEMEILKKAYEFIEGLKISDDSTDIPIIAGSGISPQNMHEYNKYCDAMIIGSSIKKHGNWENELDENLLKRLMDEYHS